MDLKQLRYFIAIAEEKNITAAAHRLHMSQPPLSMQLKQMEEELGVPLIERNGKSLELTDKGRVLYRHALNLVNSFEEVKSELQDTAEGKKGALNLGINTLSVSGFSDMLQSFHKKYPFVSIKVVQNDSFYLTELVKRREIEFAFIRLPLEHRGLTYQHLLNEPFVFVSQRDLPAITLEEISQLPLIIPSTEGLGIYHTIVESFSKEELPVTIVAECSSMQVLMELVQGGMGASVVPNSVFDVYGTNGLYSTPITNGNMTSSLGVIFLEQHQLSTPAKNFLELVRENTNSR